MAGQQHGTARQPVSRCLYSCCPATRTCPCTTQAGTSPPAVHTHPIESNYTRRQVGNPSRTASEAASCICTCGTNWTLIPQCIHLSSAHNQQSSNPHRKPRTLPPSTAQPPTLYSHSHQPGAHALSWVGVNSSQLYLDVAGCMRNRQTAAGYIHMRGAAATAALQAKIFVPKVVSATGNACRAVVTQGS